MTDKKKIIKAIVLILVAIIFFAMFYITFFKAKKNQAKPVVKKQTQKLSTAIPENTIPSTHDTSIPQSSGSNNIEIVKNPAIPFNDNVKNIFELSDTVKMALKSKQKKSKPVSVPPKRVAKTKKLPMLSAQEKISIQQTLQYKGSILTSSSSVAIINGAFIHVGDKVNGYKVTSISEKQVNIDTGRGMIILEIMKHE